MSSRTSKKRSRPSPGRKTHLPSDFAKRAKGKVGKRAKKPANVTDTSFRAASVQIRSQDGVDRSGDATATARSTKAGSLELISSRGKSLPLLLSTLCHHSPTVRLSSLGGIRDAISSSRSGPAAVRANLNSLVPALGRCAIDDDDEVRAGGVDLLKEVAARVGEDEDDDRDGVGREGKEDKGGRGIGEESAAAQHLSPYLPLLIAYVTSALNSLDVSVRLDGARAVETLVQVLGMTNVGHHAVELLPGFVRVMVDAKAGGATSASAAVSNVTGCVGSGGTTTTGGGGKKSKSDQRSSKYDPVQNTKNAAVLRSLVLLLKAAAAASSASSNYDIFNEEIGLPDCKCDALSPVDLAPSLSPPDFVFVKGGSATNALLVYRSCHAVNPNGPLLSLGALAKADRAIAPCTSTSLSAGLSIPVQVELYNTLRDRLIEVSQAGYVMGGGRGSNGGRLFLPPSFMEEMKSIVSAVRLLWTLYSRSIVAATIEALSANNSGTFGRKEKDSIEHKLRSITAAIHSQFIVMLPLSSDGGDNRIGAQDHQGRYNATNAILCSAVGELGCVLHPFDAKKSADSNKTQSSSAWTKAVFSYVLPRLEKNSGGILDGTVLRVVGQLLQGPYLDSERSRKIELLTKFTSTFFPSYDENLIEASLCVSPAGRLAALLLVELLLRHVPPPSIDTDQADCREWVLVGSMAQALPLYVRRWEDHFPLESEKVLAVLLGIVRRYKTGTPMTVDGAVLEVFDEKVSLSEDASCGSFDDADPLVLLVRSLRVSIGELFEQPKKSKEDNLQGTSRKHSIFEIMPELTQRLVLGLFGLLQYPTETAVLSLAKICSRSTLSNEMKDYVMDVVFSIRKSLPLQLYLAFLVNSSGISKAFKDRKKKKMKKQNDEKNNNGDSSIEQVFAFDIAIERLCRALVLCDSSKILRMLMPLLLTWLRGGTTSEFTAADSSAIVQRRAAIAILACISFDDSGNYGVCFEALDPRLSDSVVATVVDSLYFYAFAEDDKKHNRFLAPVLALLTKRSPVLETVLDSLLQSVLAQHCIRVDEQPLRGLIQSLTLMLKHSELGAVMKRSQFAVALEKVALAIEKSVANGPFDRMGGTLRTEMQLHIGRQVASK